MNKIKNKNIAITLAKTSVAIAFLVGLLLSSFQVYRDFLEEEDRLDNITLTILESAKHSATASVYTLSNQLAEEVINGLHEYDFISESKIIDDVGNTLAERKNTVKKRSKTRWLTHYISTEYKEYELILNQTESPLTHPGKLIIVVNIDSALSGFFSRALLVILSGVIGNILLAVLLFFIFHFIITQPIVQLAKKLQHIKPGVANHTLSIPLNHKDDELGLLTHSANNLIRESEKHTEQLRQSELRYRELYHDNPTMFFTLDLAGTILSVNNYGAAQFGYTPDELMGKSLFFIFHEQDRELAKQCIANCLDKSESISRWNARKVCKDGSVLWVRDVARVVVDKNKNITILIVCEDISEAHKLSTELAFQASHDALTGLINRREFTQRAESLLSTINNNTDNHALCFMDLDQFKVINDTCGHAAGDEMLRQLSSMLQNTLRHGDTLARLGGDEFGILFENCSVSDAEYAANSLLKAVQNYIFLWEGESFRIGVSIGLVPLDANINLTELLGMADTACYIAKDKGRNQIHIYDSDDNDTVQRRGEMQWVGHINQALEENRFCLFAQSIESLNGTTDVHYELLIRMLDESGDIIPPNSFLPAAERYDLVSKIDRWVIKSAFSQLNDNPSFLAKVDFVSINLSGPSLSNPEMLQFIIDMLSHYNISNKLCFEVTETAAISNYEMAITFITTLKSLGCRFALDDFGSGLSSYGYLKNMPVDYLKIDGLFVKDIVDDPFDHAMVKSINEIGHVMGMKTIA